MLSREKFDIMVNELLSEERDASFDMLCRIADETLRSSVKRWCASDVALAKRGYEDDIMQDVFIKLMTSTVTQFLLRNPENGVNNDPEGFEDWMFTVAKNTVRDYAAKVRRIDAKTNPDGEEAMKDIPDLSSTKDEKEETEALSKAFSIVIESDAVIYKILTWLAQSVFIVALDVKRVDSGKIIVDIFENKTLYEMRDMIILASEKIEWLRFTKEQRNRIDEELSRPYKDRRVFGDVKYSEFFMNKGGRYSVSDWVNRMNGIIKKVMVKNETFND